MASLVDGNTQDETAVVGQMFGGLTFLKTKNRTALVKFYQDRLGMKVWLTQPDITILLHGNFLMGLHQMQQDTDTLPDTQGVYTFVYPSQQAVDDMYGKLSDIATGPPRINARYRIYNFFAQDPEGRTLECQAFLHKVNVVTSDPQAAAQDYGTAT